MYLFKSIPNLLKISVIQITPYLDGGYLSALITFPKNASRIPKIE